MNKRVLIVDDVEVTRFSVEYFVKQLGFDVDSAGGVSEAMSMLENNTYDIIFMDWHIGRESGVELIKIARSTFKVKTPIYVISAVEGAESASVAIEAGAQGFVEKPTEKHKLEMCLKKENLI